MPARPEPRPARRRTPLRVWVGLFIAVALDAPVQLIWKALMIKYGDPARAPRETFTPDLLGAWHQVRWFAREVRTYGLFMLFACQFLDWIYVLGNADLSFAQPFTALSYVVVSGCAVAFFHEHLTRAAGAGHRGDPGRRGAGRVVRRPGRAGTP